MSDILTKTDLSTDLIKMIKKTGLKLDILAFAAIEEISRKSEEIIITQFEEISNSSKSTNKYQKRNKLWNRIIERYMVHFVSGVIIEASYRISGGDYLYRATDGFIKEEDIMHSLNTICPIWPFCRIKELMENK